MAGWYAYAQRRRWSYRVIQDHIQMVLTNRCGKRICQYVFSIFRSSLAKRKPELLNGLTVLLKGGLTHTSLRTQNKMLLASFLSEHRDTIDPTIAVSDQPHHRHDKERKERSKLKPFWSGNENPQHANYNFGGEVWHFIQTSHLDLLFSNNGNWNEHI